jgi:molybdopterin-containing oxidoreductase family membrane subunit
MYMIYNRAFGPYRWHWYSLMLCNVLAPQALWFPRVRSSAIGLWTVSMFINVGMWLERFVIIPTSLHRDFLPSSWGIYHGSIWDWATFLGTIGLFLSLLFLFVRFMPMISIFEMRTLVPEARAKETPQ